MRTPLQDRFGFPSMEIGDEVAIDLTGRVNYAQVRSSACRFGKNTGRRLTVKRNQGENHVVVRRET